MTSPTLQRSELAGGVAAHVRGDGEPLVLLHGVGMRAEAWGPQIKEMSKAARVIALDLPGHGQSAPLPSGSDLRVFVAWLGRALDALGLEQVNLAGHSMGALIAGGAAAEFGARIRRVALLNGVRCRAPAAREAVLARTRDLAAGGAPDIEGPLQRWFGKDVVAERYKAMAREWLRQMEPGAYLTAYHAFATGDRVYADCWPNCSCPALFITGSGDPNSTPRMSLDMADLAPNGKAVIIEGHRHVVNLTAPDQVNAHLSAWLSVPPTRLNDDAVNAAAISGWCSDTSG